MQESIDAVKQENQNLKDQRELFENQLITLRNVNESQQKLINFLNNSSANENRSSPSFFYEPNDKNHENMNDHLVIQENENIPQETFECNPYFEPSIRHNQEQTFEHTSSYTQNQENQNQFENVSENDGRSSVEQARKSYGDIIGSFQNVHNKIMEFNKNKGLNEIYEHGKIYKNTAKVEQNQKFLYEFEKEQSDYTSNNINGSNQNEYDDSNLHKYGPGDYIPQMHHNQYENRTYAQEISDFDQENIQQNITNTEAISLVNSFDKTDER